MSDLKVSVIVPCYNAERFVKDAVNSILAQTHENFELICVDDGSKDSTLDMLNALASTDNRMTVIPSENKGGSAARNLGFEKSTGAIIQFFDADDIMAPNKLEDQLAGFTDNVDVVVSDYITKDEQLTNEIAMHRFPDIEKNPLKCAIERIIITNNPLYRRHVVDKLAGYDTTLKAAQDWDFHLRMVLNDFSCKYVPGVMFISRRTAGSVSSDWVEVSEINCGLLNDFREQIMNHPLYEPSIGKYCCNMYYNTMVHSQNEDLAFLDDMQKWNVGTGFLKNPSKRFMAALSGVDRLIKMDRKRIANG